MLGFKLVSITLLILVALLALVIDATKGFAQQRQCGPRDAWVEKLKGTYQEVALGIGLQSPTQVVELWSNRETGSFSVFVTYPNGMSCILATGQSWTETVAAPAGVEQ